VPAGDQPRSRSDRWARVALAARPFLFSAGTGAAVAFFAVVPDFPPFSPLTRYGLRAGELAVAAVGAAAIWWAHRRRQSWDADVIPALVGVVTAATLLTVLHGTPYAPWGLQGDQSFRTETVTRFADTWQDVDFFYRGLPAYYAPAYFWALGRVADVFGVVPWHMLKYGTVATAFLVPLVSYLLWRRVVPPRTAALLAATVLVAQNYYEPYAWIVLAAIVPWWLEAVHGLTRPGLRPRRLFVHGLIGAALFMTYYYYFLAMPIAYAIYLLVEHRCRELVWRQVRRGLATLALTAAGSAVFWLPLAVNAVTADNYYSYNNRYFRPSMAELALPFTEPSMVGAVSLLGLGFLVWTARREALSRSLLIIAAALYVWHVLGFLMAAAGTPLMSYKMRELVTLVLLVGGVLALVRLSGYATSRFSAPDVRRLVAVGAMVLAVVGSDQYATTIVDGPDFRAAHAQPLPDGQLPRYHGDDAKPAAPSAEELRAAIDARFTGAGHPVVFTDRIDLYALYPYFGFVQWQAHYSHPTGEFRGRIDFLRKLAAASTSDEFASRTADNPFDRIDAIVLADSDGSLTFRYKESVFPYGSRARSLSIPARLVDAEHFNTVTIGGYLVAVRRS
jgi:galactan 5-O-arabinofuranosyltransferase